MRLFAGVKSALPRVLPLFRDPAVPLWLKAATVIAAGLIISPLDLFGDIPLLGFVDDAALLALLVTGFVAIAARLRGEPAPAQERRVGPPVLPPPARS
jgi:uncharacterized membrane protein YkvA (DUF1232 family)